LFLCVSICLGNGAVAQESIPSFSSFVQSYKRTYSSDSTEYAQRKIAYEKRAAVAETQNKETTKLWTAGVNEFWDWSSSEMTSLYGWVDSARPEHSAGGSKMSMIKKTNFLNKMNMTLPAVKSWNHLKTLSAVREQGACGSCWAVAAVTLLESATEVHSKQRSFSAQEIVNCVPNPKECGGQGGCKGATVELAVDWVLKYGAFEEYQAPYVGSDLACAHPESEAALVAHQSKAGKSFGMHGWETLPKNKMEPLMRALAEKGPIAVSADASPWHMYQGGIFNGCSKDAIINHAIVATGYGLDDTGVKFWDIQNSWGLHWGEHGHIRVLRTDEDDKWCGIDNKPEQGTGCKGGPSQVTVCGMCGILYDSVAVHLA